MGASGERGVVQRGKLVVAGDDRDSVGASAASDETSLGGDSCLVDAEQDQRRQSSWHFVIGYQAAVAVKLGDQFELKSRTDCQGQLIGRVAVMPYIHPTDPLHSSFARVAVSPIETTSMARSAGEAYICYARPTRRPCLARVTLPRPKFRLRHLLMKVPLLSQKARKLVQAMDLVDSALLDGVECVVFLVVFFFLGAVVHMVAGLRALPSLERVDGPPLIRHLALNSTTVRGFIAMGTFAFATATVVNVSLTALVKPIHAVLIVAIIIWPCTFGVLC